MEEREIWDTANLLIGEHGRNAGSIAARRAKKFLAQRDTAGWSTWIRIWRAIKVFQAARQRDDETMH